MFFSVNFFTPKLMKIGWSSLFLGLDSIFVIMSEIKFFLLMGVLIQNFTIVDLVKFLKKNKKLHILIVAVTLKVQNHEQKKKVEKK
jgi:hypothetical protein